MSWCGFYYFFYSIYLFFLPLSSVVHYAPEKRFSAHLASVHCCIYCHTTKWWSTVRANGWWISIVMPKERQWAKVPFLLVFHTYTHIFEHNIYTYIFIFIFFPLFRSSSVPYSLVFSQKKKPPEIPAPLILSDIWPQPFGFGLHSGLC